MTSILLALLLLASAAQANQSLVDVTCPEDVTTFTARTTMVFEGRHELLSTQERVSLNGEFRGVYNNLTETSCDSFFRRISNLTLVSMGGSEFRDGNGTVSDNGEGQGRRLQNFTNINATSEPGFEVTYDVVGTCGGCSLSSSRSFDLYDETFRRLLLQSLRRQSQNPLLEAQEDCQCVEGSLPLGPQAPGVQECVDAMNVRFDDLREQSELFHGVRITDLIQLDEGINMASPTPVPTSSPTSANAGPSWGWGY